MPWVRKAVLDGLKRDIVGLKRRVLAVEDSRAKYAAALEQCKGDPKSLWHANRVDEKRVETITSLRDKVEHLAASNRELRTAAADLEVFREANRRLQAQLDKNKKDRRDSWRETEMS